MNLQTRLIERIERDGPMPVSDYIEACLHDREHGYYATRPALGARGDFLTAPLVSQMFGEIVAGWVHAVWESLDRPPRLPLVEFGPGDGTLIGDILRAVKAAPAMAEALVVWLVETSEPLRALQRARAPDARWVERLSDVPDGEPIILIGNEFLDCLAVDQAVWREDGWRERRIGVVSGALAFVDGEPRPGPPAPYLKAIQERSSALETFGANVGERLARDGGAALFIDYGSDVPTFGDTLQALRGHAKESPLANPGKADLTAHVDFPALVRAAQRAGARPAPLETQGEFLARLGIITRAEALIRAAPDKAEVIGRQLSRLIAPDGMGELFKVCALAGPGVVLP